VEKRTRKVHGLVLGPAASAACLFWVAFVRRFCEPKTEALFLRTDNGLALARNGLTPYAKQIVANLFPASCTGFSFGVRGSAGLATLATPVYSQHGGASVDSSFEKPLPIMAAELYSISLPLRPFFKGQGCVLACSVKC
jgi:hypothetical protein